MFLYRVSFPRNLTFRDILAFDTESEADRDFTSITESSFPSATTKPELVTGFLMIEKVENIAARQVEAIKNIKFDKLRFGMTAQALKKGSTTANITDANGTPTAYYPHYAAKYKLKEENGKIVISGIADVNPTMSG